jgi:hypothetical protein
MQKGHNFIFRRSIPPKESLKDKIDYYPSCNGVSARVGDTVDGKKREYCALSGNGQTVECQYKSKKILDIIINQEEDKTRKYNRCKLHLRQFRKT